MNQIKIKDKIIEVISAYESTRPISSLENQNIELLKKKDDREQMKEEKLAKHRKEKYELKLKNAVTKSKDLKG